MMVITNCVLSFLKKGYLQLPPKDGLCSEAFVFINVLSNFQPASHLPTIYESLRLCFTLIGRWNMHLSSLMDTKIHVR